MSSTYNNSKLKVFSLNSNLALAEEIVHHIGIDLGKSSVKTFSDGEIQINIEESIRGCDVFVIQSTYDPVEDHIMELLIMTDALKRASARSINVVIPYYGYARQDRKSRAREPITAKLIADLIQKAGATRMISIDLHAPQAQGFFDIPVDPITAVPIIGKYLEAKQLENVVVVAPDHSSVSRARQLADQLKAPIAIVDRRGPRDSTSSINIVGDVADKTAIIVDDIIDTGRRITTSAIALKNHGTKEIYACSTHPVLSGIAVNKIAESNLKELIVTNTIPIPEEKQLDKITQLTIAPVIAEAIIRLYEQQSVSSLYH
ncbi:ribose-phosphate pyrophosphokinase [Gracilibacillus boraciitolerans JCM 21714]|uniref:Putative ribose-phosphate pyrophosphokinase n=1 Tax=Gracilibacillus boraciitolerans JCM 21714 TaxID=1298598 RepID=W4VGL5_9BACI|nr:ribose-phosphate pyrophosphokinase [Gracilibacillus boraciitolerans]GAE91938.1 ribose-phosphate pyrophosphokinase [Gracilibacillus boraciitolerans JCM 21714]